VVIFGQDPYPRKESAVGLAFLDGAVTSFQSPRLAPSLRNIIKAIFIARKMATPGTNADTLRELTMEHIPMSPEDWFSKLAGECGVLWLNTSLTFESKDQADLSKHLAMWEPVIRATIQDILCARAPGKPGATPQAHPAPQESQDGKIVGGGKASERSETGVVFVLWGNKAQALEKYLRPAPSPWGPTHNSKKVISVRARHPAFEPFFMQNTFGDIDAALKKLGLPDIDWLSCTATARAEGGKDTGGHTQADEEKVNQDVN